MTKKENDRIYERAFEWVMKHPGDNLWNQSGKEILDILSIDMTGCKPENRKFYHRIMRSVRIVMINRRAEKHKAEFRLYLFGGKGVRVALFDEVAVEVITRAVKSIARRLEGNIKTVNWKILLYSTGVLKGEEDKVKCFRKIKAKVELELEMVAEATELMIGKPLSFRKRILEKLISEINALDLKAYKEYDYFNKPEHKEALEKHIKNHFN